jgi:hypothetical protein
VNLFEKFQAGLAYADFLARYGSEGDRQRWQQTYDRITFSVAERELLGQFRRQMNVLCLAGAWCGDCAGQCPIFEQFALMAPRIVIRYLDRDDHADVQRALQINGGNRVPVVVFFSEDGFEVGRYGERTLSKYRQLVHDQAGVAVEHSSSGNSPLAEVTQDWLNEFERVQWLLRLSPRLRQLHGD